MAMKKINNNSAEFDMEDYSFKRMEVISQDIKSIWQQNPYKILEEGNIQKILFFPRLFVKKCKTDKISLSHLQTLDLIWKNFVYPIIKLYNIICANNAKQFHSENTLKPFTEFLQINHDSFIDCFEELRISEDEPKLRDLILYRLSMIIGDLKNYMIRQNMTNIPIDEAERFFTNALQLSNIEGIPFNQAGILLKAHQPIKSLLYFYMATLCKEPFNVAENNATNLLDSMRESFFGHIKKKAIINDQTQLLEVSFVNMIDVFLNRIDDVTNSRIERLAVNYKLYLRNQLKSSTLKFSSQIDIAILYCLLLAICMQKSLIFKSILKYFKSFYSFNYLEFQKYIIKQLKEIQKRNLESCQKSKNDNFVDVSGVNKTQEKNNASDDKNVNYNDLNDNIDNNNINNTNDDDNDQNYHNEDDDYDDDYDNDSVSENSYDKSMNSREENNSNSDLKENLDEINKIDDKNLADNHHQVDNNEDDNENLIKSNLRSWCYLNLMIMCNPQYISDKKHTTLRKLHYIMVRFLNLNSLIESNGSTKSNEVNYISPFDLALSFITHKSVTDNDLISHFLLVSKKYNYSTKRRRRPRNRIYRGKTSNSRKDQEVAVRENNNHINNIDHNNNNKVERQSGPISLPQKALAGREKRNEINIFAKHIIPLSDVFISDLELFKNLEHKHKHFVHILTSVLDGLDLVKESNKGARDVISFINEAFNQESTILVPESSDARDTYTQKRHRNKRYVELSNAMSYAEYLLSFDKKTTAEHIAILVPSIVMKDSTYFSVCDSIRSLGLQLLEFSEKVEE